MQSEAKTYMLAKIEKENALGHPGQASKATIQT